MKKNKLIITLNVRDIPAMCKHNIRLHLNLDGALNRDIPR